MDKELIAFIQAMEHADWKPKYDMWKNINEWRHTVNTLRRVNHNDAFKQWKLTKLTPVPF